MSNWYGKITSRSQLIDKDANEKALASIQDAADELHAVATRMLEIAHECGDGALTASVGGVSKFIAGAIDKIRQLAPWNWGKDIVSADPGAKSIKKDIEDAADIVLEYANSLEEKAKSLRDDLNEERRLQNNALEAYEAEQLRKAREAKEEQAGEKNG